MSHHQILVTTLRRDILAAAAQTHTLSLCPVCGGKLLTSWACSLGHPVVSWVGDQRAKQWDYLCRSCRITWHLHVFNQTHERNAYNSYFHSLRLSGTWDCVCGATVLTRGTHYFYDSYADVHDFLAGHALLGEKCGTWSEGHRPRPGVTHGVPLHTQQLGR